MVSLENYTLRDKMSNGDDKHVKWKEEETILFRKLSINLIVQLSV